MILYCNLLILKWNVLSDWLLADTGFNDVFYVFGKDTYFYGGTEGKFPPLNNTVFIFIK